MNLEINSTATLHFANEKTETLWCWSAIYSKMMAASKFQSWGVVLGSPDPQVLNYFQY